MQNQVENYVSYENYNETSKNYDSSRRAIGLKEIEDLLSKVAQKKGVKVSDLVILDAGCGTGNYTEHLYQKVKKIIGVEYNEGMCTEFRKKFADKSNITLCQESIFGTTLESDIADVVIINQVIHHLDTQNKQKTTEELSTSKNEYPNILKAMTELFRLLKPGGALACNFTPVEQMFGVWYINHLYPKEKTEEVWNKLCPNKAKMEKLMTSIGYQDITLKKIDDPFMYDQTYYDLNGPFSKNYRDGDSFWGLITEKETEQCLENLKSILEKDSDGKFRAKIEQEFKEIGQSTTCICYKA